LYLLCAAKFARKWKGAKTRMNKSQIGAIAHDIVQSYPQHFCCYCHTARGSRKQLGLPSGRAQRYDPPSALPAGAIDVKSRCTNSRKQQYTQEPILERALPARCGSLIQPQISRELESVATDGKSRCTNPCAHGEFRKRLVGRAGTVLFVRKRRCF
jgi:hypothetical protein